MPPRKFKHLDSPEEVRRTALGEQPMRSNLYGPGGKVLAEVQKYDPKSDTYLLVTRGLGGEQKQAGGRRLPGVPRRVEDPGTIAPLENGTVVVVDMSLGFPYIDGVLNINASSEKRERAPKPPSLAGAEGSTVTEAMVSSGMPGYYKNVYTPEDVVPGDHVRMSPDGNYIAVLRGKENRMFGSEKAQISVIGLNDLVRIICEDYEQFNGFGTFKVSNAEGRGNVEIRGGADQLTESGGEEEQWTFHVDVGDQGELFDMRVTTPEGKTLSQFKLTPDGQIKLMAVKGIELINADGAPRSEEIGGDYYRRVGGSTKDRIAGSSTTIIEGEKVTRSSETEKKVIGNDQVKTINRNKIGQVGGNVNETVTGGDPLTANPTNKAVDIGVLNGSYFLEMGNPTAGANPAALAGYNVFVNNGAITFGENPSPLAPPASLAHVNLNTLQPNSVALGGTVGPGPTMAVQHAMLFEPWSAMMATMIGLLDSHTHATAWGPSGPAMAPAPGGFASALSSVVPNISSIRVLIGA
jgi:hypothetical protein